MYSNGSFWPFDDPGALFRVPTGYYRALAFVIVEGLCQHMKNKLHLYLVSVAIRHQYRRKVNSIAKTIETCLQHVNIAMLE